jgi:hypothetical protein
MQKNALCQLKTKPPASVPDGSKVKVAGEYWEILQAKDIHSLCNLTLFSAFAPQQLVFHFLREDVLVDCESRCLKRWHHTGWQPSDDPLLELVTVLYLANVTRLYPIGKDIVGVNDLKEGHFFQGPHALKTEALLRRYGTDVKGFKRAAEYLEGVPQNMADAAYRLLPFPRIPLYFLLWEGDQEFKPRLSVLFDRSIELVLAADAIWALVNRVSTALLEEPPTVT